jgi:hypothetical protein
MIAEQMFLEPLVVLGNTGRLVLPCVNIRRRGAVRQQNEQADWPYQVSREMFQVIYSERALTSAMHEWVTCAAKIIHCGLLNVNTVVNILNVRPSLLHSAHSK